MKRLWVLPIAALLCGRAVDPPRLKPPLPEHRKNLCAVTAQKAFLLAYAYRFESAAKSRRLLDTASETLSNCEEPLLRARIIELIVELKNSFL